MHINNNDLEKFITCGCGGSGRIQHGHMRSCGALVIIKEQSLQLRLTEINGVRQILLVDDTHIADADSRILILEAGTGELHMHLRLQEADDRTITAIGSVRIVRAIVVGSSNLSQRNTGFSPSLVIIVGNGREVIVLMRLVLGERRQVKLCFTNAIGNAVDKPRLWTGTDR